MAEFEHSVVVHAAPDTVFQFVSDVRNLPKYLPTTHQASSEGPERVRVQGEAGGHSYESDGYFRINDVDFLMEWGSDGENAYSGWLEVEELEDNLSEVTVHLSFLPRADQGARMDQQTGDRNQTIQEGLEAALLSIQNIVEGRGEKVESRAAS